MPLRYKVGDKVRVGEWYGGDRSTKGLNFAYDMEDYVGKIVTVSRISSEIDCEYKIEEDGGNFYWSEEFFEPADQTFAEDNVLLLRNGQMRVVYEGALYLPNGTCIEIDNYTGRKHNFDENFDIVEAHRKSTSNYKFDMSGELIQEEM